MRFDLVKKTLKVLPYISAVILGSNLVNPPSIATATLDKWREEVSLRRESEILDKTLGAWIDNTLLCYEKGLVFDYILGQIDESKLRRVGNSKKKIELFFENAGKAFEPKECEKSRLIEGRIDAYVKLSPRVSRMSYEGFIPFSDAWEIMKREYKDGSR
jgi:hypothetical protein